MSSSSSLVTLSELMKPGNTAVVTGASSGIGKAACIAFVKAGMNCWMIDNDAEELEKSYCSIVNDSGGLTISGQLIQTAVIDVSDEIAMKKLAEERVFVDENSKCHILMNNAGVGYGGDPITTDMATVRKTMEINTYGPIHGCIAFIPKMKIMNEPGIIINVGSKQGITMPPGNTTYNMSKAALKCYTEGLEHELMNDRMKPENPDNPGKLRACLLVPGWVNTSILLKTQRKKAMDAGETFDPTTTFFHENKPASGAWMPIEVIEYMIKVIDEGKFYIICPDNDVTNEVDNLRMTWTMQDITKNRPPLSRWHPEYKEQFNQYIKENITKEEK